MGHARRATLRQADAKFCEETSGYSGKGPLIFPDVTKVLLSQLIRPFGATQPL
jgi:hypothetical protein